METIISLFTLEIFVLAMAVGVVAGIIKGLVGFAMPTILISGLGSFLSPELALAALILPTLAANGIQALRQGLSPALASIRKFRIFLLVGLCCLILSAQLVPYISERVLYLLIGTPVMLFSITMLFGWTPRLRPGNRAAEGMVGAFAGGIGGVSGIWGPPTVIYLTAIDTPKQESMRVQGTVYGLGALTLFGAHVQSGVLNAQTLPLSFAMVPPALLGIWLGFKWQDRIDQRAFKRLTLLILLIAGANLIRRGLIAA